RNGTITMGHARALAGVSDLTLQIALHKQVVDKNLSVRALENLIRGDQNPPSSGKKPMQALDADIRRVQDSLSAIFGTKVSVKRSPRGSGQISIHFKSDQALNEILDILEKLED